MQLAANELGKLRDPETSRLWPPCACSHQCCKHSQRLHAQSVTAPSLPVITNCASIPRHADQRSREEHRCKSEKVRHKEHGGAHEGLSLCGPMFFVPNFAGAHEGLCLLQTGSVCLGSAVKGLMISHLKYTHNFLGCNITTSVYR